MKIIITTADDIHKHASDQSLVMVQFSRDAVMKGLTGGALHSLMTISDSPELSRQYANRLMFCFDGFDRDKREVIAIPECRTFFAALTNAWPFWFHFIVKDTEVFPLVFSLLCDIEVTEKGGYQLVGMKDLKQFEQLAYELFGGMNQLYDLHGFSEDMNEKTTALVTEQMMKMLSHGNDGEREGRPGKQA